MSIVAAIINRLTVASDSHSCFDALIYARDNILGSTDKRKLDLVDAGIVEILVRILPDDNLDPRLRSEASTIVCSLVKGPRRCLDVVIGSGRMELFLKGMCHPNSKLAVSFLRTVRAIVVQSPTPEIISAFYSVPMIIPHLIRFVATHQEIVMDILSLICVESDHQNVLFTHGAVNAVSIGLCCGSKRILVSGLRFLTSFCRGNYAVSSFVAAVSSDFIRNIPDKLVELMGQNNPTEIQLESAKCMTHICKAGGIPARDDRIIFKTLPTLIRLCKKELEIQVRVEAAETLALLMEMHVELQRLASLSNQLMLSLFELLKYTPPLDTNDDEKEKISRSSAIAAFKAFASLAAEDADIRKILVGNGELMDHVMRALSDPGIDIKIPALLCLHNLSRSVHTLRMAFQSQTIWTVLVEILVDESSPLYALAVASGTLCNLLLEFSPTKEEIVKCRITELLSNLVKRPETDLRLNGIWALMNMTYRADQNVITLILSSVGMDKIVGLAEDPVEDVRMKALGLLRNLVGDKLFVDSIMVVHGKAILDVTTSIMRSDGSSADLLEQVLCLVANLCEGELSVDFVMHDEDLLGKLAFYLACGNVKVQTAATLCVMKLVDKKNEQSVNRQAVFREMGVQRVLQELVERATDPTLLGMVGVALEQFETIQE